MSRRRAHTVFPVKRVREEGKGGRVGFVARAHRVSGETGLEGGWGYGFSGVNEKPP